MLSSPGTLQIAKITRSAVCNSSLAPNKKRVVGGFCFIGEGVQTSRGLPDVFSLCSLWQKGKHKPLKQQVSDKNNSWRCFASLVTAANCHLRAGAERCAEHLSSPQPLDSTERPVRGTAPALLSVRTVCPDSLPRSCHQQRRVCAMVSPDSFSNTCRNASDEGIGASGCTVGCLGIPYRHRHLPFFCKDVCAKPTCLLNNAEILLPPENLMIRLGWCRGFLVLLLYLKMNFTINRVSVSKFVNTALCINKCME